MRRPLQEMTKKDIIETILFILEQILSYTSKLNQSTTSIFDKTEKDEKAEPEHSTDCSDALLDKNEIIERDSPKNEKLSLSDLIYYWSEVLNSTKTYWY